MDSRIDGAAAVDGVAEGGMSEDGGSGHVVRMLPDALAATT
jgi:hypothetical protein